MRRLRGTVCPQSSTKRAQPCICAAGAWWYTSRRSPCWLTQRSHQRTHLGSLTEAALLVVQAASDARGVAANRRAGGISAGQATAQPGPAKPVLRNKAAPADSSAAKSHARRSDLSAGAQTAAQGIPGKGGATGTAVGKLSSVSQAPPSGKRSAGSASCSAKAAGNSALLAVL